MSTPATRPYYTPFLVWGTEVGVARQTGKFARSSTKFNRVINHCNLQKVQGTCVVVVYARFFVSPIKIKFKDPIFLSHI